MRKLLCCSVQHAALISWDHVLNVDEGVIATVSFKHLQCLRNHITQILTLALAVVDWVSLIQVPGLEEVHDGKNLTVVGYKGLTNGVTALDELLKDVECRGDNLRVTSVQSGCTNTINTDSNIMSQLPNFWLMPDLNKGQAKKSAKVFQTYSWWGWLAEG